MKKLFLLFLTSTAWPLSVWAGATAGEAAHVPAGLAPPRVAKPVVIAIIDDGLRTSHRSLAPFIFENKLEVAGNFRNDDGNGKVDDTHGWDIADEDPEPQPAVGREEAFGHGTQLASLIAQVARQAYGDRGPKLIKILSVKAAKDIAQPVLIMEGYEGIAYAVNQGANIILCAWGKSFISQGEQEAISYASKNGVLIIAATGNTHQESPQYPAAHIDVLSVTAHGALGQKLPNAAYGSLVDVFASGEAYTTASATSDTEF